MNSRDKSNIDFLKQLFELVSFAIKWLFIIAFLAMVFIFCTSCKFSRQAQKSTSAATHSTATDSTAAQVSRSDKSETDEWSRETETNYTHGQEKDSAGNVYNYYYPIKIIERESGRKQKNVIATDSSHKQIKKATADSTATMASGAKFKAAGFNQLWILAIVAGVALVLIGGKWLKNNFTVSRKSIL